VCLHVKNLLSHVRKTNHPGVSKPCGCAKINARLRKVQLPATKKSPRPSQPSGSDGSGLFGSYCLNYSATELRKLQKKKEVPAIIAAHGIDYVATASAAYPLDLYDKIKKAKTMSGPKYIHVHCPCPAGWGFDPRYTVKIGKLAVETGLYDIYEIEQGKFQLTGPSKKLDNNKRKPVSEYFKTQSRFRALSDERIQEIQQSIDAKWEEYRK
jgi:pyruvate/2-oxoacid:ferredoxin oxidoreductase beta subunit